MKYFMTLFSLFAILALLSIGRLSGEVKAASSTLEEAAFSEVFSSSPLMFIENVGQFDDRARFQVRGTAGTMWVASDGLWLTLLEADERLKGYDAGAHASPTDSISPDATLTTLPIQAGRGGVHLKLSFVGANPALIIEPFDALDTKVNTIDFMGTLAPDVPSTDSDGDKLLNQTEVNGWTNTAGTFMTDPNDPDSDDDGLWDGQEKLFDSHPNNDKVPGASLTGEYSDSGLDLDNDGKYEQLMIHVGLNIAISQPYTMSAELHDSTDKLIGVATWSGISAFAQLRFDGIGIYKNGMDGPYKLRYLRLENANHEIIAFIDSPHTTQAYDYEEFDSPAATLTEQYNDYGQDSNGNQLYEELMIEVELTVSETGLYLIEGWLIDQNGRSVTWASSDPAFLDVGTHTLALTFDGEAILANETSGTFTLQSLRVIQSIGYNLLDERLFAMTTKAYKHTAFEASQNDGKTMLYLPLVVR